MTHKEAKKKIWGLYKTKIDRLQHYLYFLTHKKANIELNLFKKGYVYFVYELDTLLALVLKWNKKHSENTIDVHIRSVDDFKIHNSIFGIATNKDLKTFKFNTTTQLKEKLLIALIDAYEWERENEAV